MASVNRVSPTQNTLVLRHLEQGHALTSLTAFRLWNLTRLSGRIFELRKAGYNIEATKERSGRNSYAVYRLASAQKEEYASTAR